MGNWRKFWNLFSADCTGCLWLLREDGNAVSGVQLGKCIWIQAPAVAHTQASRAFWTSLGHPAGPSAPAAEGFGSPAGLAVVHGSSVWKSEIHRGILNSTSCWHVGAAFISCPHSLAVGIWTIVSQTDFNMQTSICRCLPPSLYAIEGERFMSRGCLDIPRAGPSCDVLYTAHFSTDTLGGLTAVHKFRVRPRDWTKREEREDTDLCLAMGKLSRQCWVCAHALGQHHWVVLSEELLLGQEGALPAVLAKRWTHRPQTHCSTAGNGLVHSHL